ncbi:MAG: MarR family transcriptional regulator [Desulfobacteraceae bacterium]|nr:MarR family transcriptional regulator [Desulfobacteraceae bacterium]
MKVYEMAGELMIGSRLKRLSEKFLSDVSKVYKSQGIPFETAYFPVFYLLNLHGTLTVSHVARELEITQSGASQMINSLVKKGLVRYDKDKDDKRIRRASFTPRGILLLDQVEPVWESIGKCFRTILEQGDNSRYLFQALGEIEESIAKKNLFSRVSKDLEKKNLLKKVVFSLYDPSLEKEYKALALSWLVENSFAKTFDTDFINKTGRMVEKGLGIVRLAKIEKNVVGAFYLSKIGGDRSEILVFSVEDSRENPDLAQLLLSRLLETMKEEKITRVSIRLNRRLAPLIKLFRGAGFSLDCLEKHKEETGFVLTKKG